MTDGRWRYANRLRRGVSRSIDVAECIIRRIVISVIGPQSAGGEGFAKGKASPKRLAERASEVPRLHHARRGPRRFCSVGIVAAKIKRSSKFWGNFDFSEGEKKISKPTSNCL
jgi:hypothetical protein